MKTTQDRLIEQKSLVESLEQYPWQYFFHLTTKDKQESPGSLLSYMGDFFRRIDGTSKKKCSYWYCWSPFKVRGDWHIHGFLGNVGDLTPEQIDGCWTTRNIHWYNPHTEKREWKRFRLGRTRIDPYDGREGGYWYCVKQMEGYVTNVEREVGV